YLLNDKSVFKSRENHGMAAGKYFLLAVIQMACSAGLVSLLYALTGGFSELVIKICVDVFLFFISFQIQREFVYKKRGASRGPHTGGSLRDHLFFLRPVSAHGGRGGALYLQSGPPGGKRRPQCHCGNQRPARPAGYRNRRT